MKTISTLAIALTLTACGSSQNDEKEGALSEATAGIVAPNLTGWQIMPDATESCTETGSAMNCTIEFTAGESNCGDATFKFIVKTGGHEYVQTLEHVIIRQGEFHQLKFDSDPEVFAIADKLADEMSHAVQCYGLNGQIVVL